MTACVLGVKRQGVTELSFSTTTLCALYRFFEWGPEGPVDATTIISRCLDA